MLTDKQQAAWAAYEQYRNQQKAADSLGISRRAFRNHFDAAKAKIYGTPYGFKTTKIATNNHGEITAMQHKIAPEITDEKRTGKVVRRSTLYGADGSVTGEWIIRQPEEVEQNEYVAALDKHFVKNVQSLVAPPVLLTPVLENELAVFLSVDDHIGVRLTQQMEGRNYGLNDAVKILTDSFSKLIARTPITNHCLYVNLGDKFHANDHKDVTPGHAHPMHSDSDFDTVADAVVALEITRVQQLLKLYNTVDIRGVRGNHDIDPTGWLYRCLALAFKDEPRVHVEFYADGLGMETWGRTFLGFHHGDKMKPEVMAGAAADRYPEEYGSTKMRYLHTGHVHHDAAKDLWGGFKWESHRTAAPKDRFSNVNGYVSRQVMKSMVYDKNEGEVGRYQVTL